jgi:hypothetical protein
MFDARMVDDDHADSAPVLPFRASSHALMLACKRMFRSTVSVKTSNADTFNCSMDELGPGVSITDREDELLLTRCLMY